MTEEEEEKFIVFAVQTPIDLKTIKTNNMFHVEGGYNIAEHVKVKISELIRAERLPPTDFKLVRYWTADEIKKAVDLHKLGNQSEVIAKKLNEEFSPQGENSVIKGYWTGPFTVLVVRLGPERSIATQGLRSHYR